MKKILFVIAAAIAVCSCGSKVSETTVDNVETTDTVTVVDSVDTIVAE